ncbi:hypothetical protein BDZ89DRAFT_1059709 [Hymenopellis radicata]|nr:hypothetical protein BDZ89DRAFT_1059709 [Hymenopellis radicata]
MHFSLTVASALLATAISVSASSLGLMRRQYPDCANSCIYGKNIDYHGCGSADIPCLCNNSDYLKETSACLVNSCSGDNLNQALSIGQGLCENVGVTLQSSDVFTSTAAASGGSAAGSATTTSAGTSSSSTGSNAALNLNGFTALTGLATSGLVVLLL